MLEVGVGGNIFIGHIRRKTNEKWINLNTVMVLGPQTHR